MNDFDDAGLGSGRLDLRAVETRARCAMCDECLAVERALLAHSRALRAALQPFADRAEYYRRADEGTMLHTERVMVEVGDLRRAAEVLNAAGDAAGAAPEEER